MMRRLPDEPADEHTRDEYLVSVLETLSQVLRASGDYAGAASLLREVVATRRRMYGERDHSDVVTALVHLGACLPDVPSALAALREGWPWRADCTRVKTIGL